MTLVYGAADEAPGLVVHAGDDDGCAVGAGQLEAAVDLIDVARQASAADVGGADAELAQPPGEALLVPGGGVQDAERAGERGVDRAVQREERDLRVDLGDVAPAVAVGAVVGCER